RPAGCERTRWACGPPGSSLPRVWSAEADHVVEDLLGDGAVAGPGALDHVSGHEGAAAVAAGEVRVALGAPLAPVAAPRGRALVDAVAGQRVACPGRAGGRLVGQVVEVPTRLVDVAATRIDHLG